MRFTRRDFLRFAGMSGVGWVVGAQVLPPAPALRILTTQRSIPALPKGQQLSVISETIIGKWELVIGDFDLAIVPANILTQLIRQNLVQELAISHPLSASGYSPSAISPQRPYDPQDSFSRLAARGIIGINARNIKPPQTWQEFFALAQTVPTYLPPVESLHAVLKSFGESINTRHTYLRAQAQSLISNLKSFPLARAQLAIALPLSGWHFVAPHEGVELWEDNFCIPVNSTQPVLVQEFIARALQQQKLSTLPAVKMEMKSVFG